MFWNADRIEALRTLWSDGLSASTIGERLGTTRNSVIGKVHRENFPPRTTSVRKIVKERAGKTHSRGHPGERHKLYSKRQPASAKVFAESFREFADNAEAFENLGFGAPSGEGPKPLPEPRPTDIPHISVADLEAHHCKWVCAEMRTIDTPVYCGCPTVPGLPYCQGHAVRAYKPPENPRGKFRLEALDSFARARPRFIVHKESEDA
jgi:GcrA cell cycle regulator